MQHTPTSRFGLVLCGLLLCVIARADESLHSLWELHGKHNTVYLLGSIHVLRSSDYPLAPAVLAAYNNAKSLLMEVNLEEISSPEVQAEMLSSASLPDGETLPEVLGRLVMSMRMHWRAKLGSTYPYLTNLHHGSSRNPFRNCN